MTTTTTRSHSRSESGFTLIELSIVLVIIGLIVGGVLVGQDLIRAAEIRAQISQIEKYNTAVNTFRGKFNAIPGDMSASTVSTFNFTQGTSCDGSGVGKRDGNGLIDGGTTAATSSTVYGIGGAYEAGLIWQDLSSSVGGNLIEGSVSGIDCTTAFTTSSGTMLASKFPTAKLGRGMYITAFNNGSYNWWGLFGFTATTSGLPSATSSSTYPMTVSQAYNIDKKMDDGAPTTGNVVAQYISSAGAIATANIATGGASTTYCYDSTGLVYNIGQASGQASNCALAFRFQ